MCGAGGRENYIRYSVSNVEEKKRQPESSRQEAKKNRHSRVEYGGMWACKGTGQRVASPLGFGVKPLVSEVLYRGSKCGCLTFAEAMLEALVSFLQT